MRGVRMTLMLGCAAAAIVALNGVSTAASGRATNAPSLSARQLHRLFSSAPPAGRRGYVIRPRAHSSIVGGTSASQGTWGFMAFIVHNDDAGNPDFYCSGTLIAPTVVLTAAHCAADDSSGESYNPGRYLVVTGAVDITDTAHRQLSYVRAISVDPNYEPEVFAGDAALLWLTTPSSAPTVRIARAGETTQYAPGTSALIAGWGSTYAGGAGPTVLRAAPTNVQAPTYCAEFSDWFRPSWETCAAQVPAFVTGTCSGDSGGPLLAMDANGRPVEIGVTSVGPRNCNTQTADYFTRTDAIANWVGTLVAPVTGSSPPPQSSTTTTTTTNSTTKTNTTTTTVTTTTTTSTTSTPPPVSKPTVTLPALTMTEARAYAATMVRARTHKTPKLDLSCRRVNTWTMQCSIGWRDGSGTYALSGRFFHYLQGKQVYWWYSFTGTRRWRTCRVQHGQRLCTAYIQRFSWS